MKSYPVNGKNKAEDAEKRMRAIFNTVLPGLRATYEGRALLEKEEELLLKAKKLLSEQDFYSEKEVLECFNSSKIPPINKKPEALKAMVIASSDVLVIDLKIKRRPLCAA